MKVSIKHAAYISDLKPDIIKDLIMAGLHESPTDNIYSKIDSIMIPIDILKDFISSYPDKEEYIRARYRMIFNLISDTLRQINNEIPYNNEIQHAFFIKKLQSSL